MPRSDFMQSQVIESVPDHLDGGFGAIAAVPIGKADPVTELRSAVPRIDAETDASDQGPVLLEGHRKNEILPGFQPLGVGCNPVRGHAFLIRMGKIQSRLRDPSVSGQLLNACRIGKKEGSQDKPESSELVVGGCHFLPGFEKTWRSEVRRMNYNFRPVRRAASGKRPSPALSRRTRPGGFRIGRDRFRAPRPKPGACPPTIPRRRES